MRIWFDCSHKKTTFPITLPDRARKVHLAADSHRTYITCLDCGKEIPYSWEMMKVIPGGPALFKSTSRPASSAA